MRVVWIPGEAGTMQRLILIVLSVVGLAVLVLAGLVAYGIHQEYYRYGENHNISYAADRTGMYQIGYDSFTYVRRQPCGPQGAAIPGHQSCVSARPIACVSQRQLQLQHLWPLKQVGDVPAAGRSHALYRPSQQNKPRALLVAHGPCYQEYW